MANAFDKFDEANPFDKFDAPAPAKSGNYLSDRAGELGNMVAGGVRGAGSIGATLLAPWDMAVDAIKGDRGKNLSYLVTGQELPSRNKERRSEMDAALRSFGADPESNAFQAAKFGAEVLGTLGTGGAVGSVVGRVAPTLGRAVASGGFNAGNGATTLPGKAVDLLTRATGGAINGGATAGLVDPEYAPAGMALGGALAPAVRGVGAMGDLISQGMDKGSNRLMQSAIKPTIKQLQTGDSATAVQTLLDRGINPNAAGVEKLRSLIDGVDGKISAAITNSSATIDKQAVLSRLAGTNQRFSNQVSPGLDLKAIQGVADDFLSHPGFPLPMTSIPVQAAQDMKRGTYQVLAKKYGQLGSAETEAQKGLARGLKEEIAAAVPEVSALNAEQSNLLTTLKVSERRALMEMNKNPMGLAALATSPVSWAMFMADKSALFKSLAARSLNSIAPQPARMGGLLQGPASSPLLRGGLLQGHDGS